jgi:hypothetical protein
MAEPSIHEGTIKEVRRDALSTLASESWLGTRFVNQMTVEGEKFPNGFERYLVKEI